MEELKRILAEYRWRIIGVAGGILLTILIFTLGFWRTLLLAAIVAVCYLLGNYIDQGGKASGFAEAIAALFSKK